jgi:hypothetical protein
VPDWYAPEKFELVINESNFKEFVTIFNETNAAVELCLSMWEVGMFGSRLPTLHNYGLESKNDLEELMQICQFVANLWGDKIQAQMDFDKIHEDLTSASRLKRSSRTYNLFNYERLPEDFKSIVEVTDSYVVNGINVDIKTISYENIPKYLGFISYRFGKARNRILENLALGHSDIKIN